MTRGSRTSRSPPPSTSRDDGRTRRFPSVKSGSRARSTGWSPSSAFIGIPSAIRRLRILAGRAPERCHDIAFHASCLVRSITHGSVMSSPAALCLIVAALAWSACLRADPLPLHLRDTGIDDPRNLAFSPQYPLWSDGAHKRRWIQLPPGTAIDATRPDAWVFPPGTRLWKEFALERPIETRLIEQLADGSWRYATYVWNEEG